MARVANAQDLWETSLTDTDIQVGVEYGIISRAWTYDRMGAQARGDFGRAIFRIGVGRAIQNALERLLAQRGIRFERDTTDYMTEDYWDISTPSGESVDLKAFHVFTNYSVPGRPPLTREAIVCSNTGEDWHNFFPMLIPKDQFDTNPKDYYIFAVIQANSSGRFPNVHIPPKFLITLPFSQDNKELNERYKLIHRRRNAEERMAMGRTFSMELLSLETFGLFSTRRAISVGYGDAVGSAKIADVTLAPGQRVRLDGLTALHYIRLNENSVEQLQLSQPLFRATFHNVDNAGPMTWVARARDFEDIWIYDNRVLFVGWIPEKGFDAARRKYPAWGPNASYTGNAPHHDPTQRGLLSRRSFCYFYPPAFRGGTQNPNYYCLPQDLETMDSLAVRLR